MKHPILATTLAGLLGTLSYVAQPAFGQEAGPSPTAPSLETTVLNKGNQENKGGQDDEDEGGEETGGEETEDQHLYTNPTPTPAPLPSPLPGQTTPNLSPSDPYFLIKLYALTTKYNAPKDLNLEKNIDKYLRLRVGAPFIIVAKAADSILGQRNTNEETDKKLKQFQETLEKAIKKEGENIREELKNYFNREDVQAYEKSSDFKRFSESDDGKELISTFNRSKLLEFIHTFQ